MKDILPRKTIETLNSLEDYDIPMKQVIESRQKVLDELRHSFITSRVEGSIRAETVKDRILSRIDNSLDKIPIDQLESLYRTIDSSVEKDMKFLTLSTTDSKSSTTNNTLVVQSRDELVSQSGVSEALSILMSLAEKSK